MKKQTHFHIVYFWRKLKPGIKVLLRISSLVKLLQKLWTLMLDNKRRNYWDLFHLSEAQF